MLVARPLNGAFPVGALRVDAIADIVARRTKKTDTRLRVAALTVCRAAKPTLPLIVEDTLDAVVARALNASLAVTATRAADTTVIVALKTKDDDNMLRAAELMV